MLFVVSMASSVPDQSSDSNSTTVQPRPAPSNTSSLTLGPQKTILGLSVDTFSYIFLSIGGAAPVIFILIVIVGMKCYSNRRMERIKREREMFQTSMELWEAERRYQANVADRARGYERPGLTSLAEAEALDALSRSGLVMNGRIPNNSAHAAGVRISTNNPNVFFRETSLTEISSSGKTSSLERDNYYGNRREQSRKKNMSNSNNKAKRNGKYNNKDGREIESRNRYSKSAGNASQNVTTESAIVSSSDVSMDTKTGGKGLARNGHVVALPLKDGRQAGSGNTRNEDGVGVLYRQISTGTLSHSINSEERMALEVFDQIYEEHISDDEPGSHQGSSGKKSSGMFVHRQSSLGRQRRHEYENTMYSVLGPDFQEGTTSFVQIDTGEQSDSPSVCGPFMEKDGCFYFMGRGENIQKNNSYSDRNDTVTDINSADAHNHSKKTIREKHGSRHGSVQSNEDSPSKQWNNEINLTQVITPRVKGSRSQEDNHVTTVTEQNDNGSVTSYTIKSNIRSDNHVYHSTVIISQNSQFPPSLSSLSSHPTYTINPSETSSMTRGVSDNDTEQWNTLQSDTTLHRSHVSDIDDCSSSVEQEAMPTNQDQGSLPEYAHLHKVDMSIHRVQNEDLNKASSWLHKEFINTAYVSD